MNWTHAVACSVGILLGTSSPVDSQEIPTSLTCTSNAKAERNYGFSEKRWFGRTGQLFELSRLFAIGTRDSKTSWGAFELRDKVFSGLNTQEPIIRSITRHEKGPEDAAEFVGLVVSRTFDAVFLAWTNDFKNKVWLAVIDLIHRRATVTQVFRGITSVGGEIETLDCR